MSDRGDLILGVDAGGTKTTAWLGRVTAEAEKGPMGQGTTGAGNPKVVGIEQATQEIRGAIEAAFRDADIRSGCVAAICLGVAGAGREREQKQIEVWAQSQHVAKRIHVTHDAEPIVAAASPKGVGIALISGTGSLAWGRNASGASHRTGGWGHLFGDEGSGYAIALAGLRAASRAADGRGPTTQLLETLMTRLDAASPTDIINRIYHKDASRDAIANLCDVVFATASQDPVASQIISQAAFELAEMVQVLATRLSLPIDRLSLGLSGGVLVHQAAFRAAVLDEIGVGPQQAAVVEHPVAGALELARRLSTNNQ